jgi:hypothetical protein
MAKRTKRRERPTLKTLRELRATIDGLQRELSRSTALLTDIQATDATVLERAMKQTDLFNESRGILHSFLDELGQEYVSPIANKARRFLGRAETKPKSSIQRLVEAHAKADARLALAN